MAYFTTTTNGGTVRFHDESELTPVPGNTLNPPVVPALGSDYDLDYRPMMKEEYIPSKLELLQRHEIVLQFMSVGCLIRIGCKSIPFESVEDAMKEVNAYVNNPHESIKKWEKIFGK
jgi:hypothetical protein